MQREWPMPRSQSIAGPRCYTELSVAGAEWGREWWDVSKTTTWGNLSTLSLEETFPNFSMNQGSWKHRLWWPHPQVSTISTKFSSDVDEAGLGPNSENLASGTSPYFTHFTRSWTPNVCPELQFRNPGPREPWTKSLIHRQPRGLHRPQLSNQVKRTVCDL